MAKRLIDANELKQRILVERDKIPFTLPGATYEFGIAKPNHHGNSMRGGIRKALRCMEQCKTVDSVEVVHGRWRIIDFKGNVECSECGYTMDLEYKYCPNCGAQMDGGADNG